MALHKIRRFRTHGQHLIISEGGGTVAVTYTDLADAELIVRAVNSHAALVEAIEHVRALITEASETGFNSKSGDWAERLFRSQALTHSALREAAL